jgi:drug/metabolite transporter (DMT)-like permease
MNSSPPIWLIMSLLTALAVSSQEAFAKKFFSHLTPWEMSGYQFAYSLPLFWLALPWIDVPALGEDFLWSFLASIPLNGVPFLIHMAAIKASPLSLTLPYLAFTPVFMIATGAFFLGEIPNAYGISGILSICAGSYILNLEPGRWTFTGPFKAFFRETGSRLMLLVAFIYSFSGVIGKVAIVNSSPLFFSVFFFATFNSLLLVFLMLIGKICWRTFSGLPREGAFTGLLFFLHVLFHGYAVSMTKAAYMISVKRLSVLFGVAYGAVLFREENIRMRFLGALFMVSGAVLIMLKG